jgi:hypothetical protein
MGIVPALCAGGLLMASSPFLSPEEREKDEGVCVALRTAVRDVDSLEGLESINFDTIFLALYIRQ